MPRPLRLIPPRTVFHVFNRAIEGVEIFKHEPAFDAFERILEEAVERHQVNVYEYVTMRNHVHLQASARVAGEMSRFMKWLTQTHAQRWRKLNGTAGRGHVFQSRFSAVPVQGDEHFLTLAAYIERNPVRAGWVRHAAEWRWSGLARFLAGEPVCSRVLSPWPVARPHDWLEIVARPVAAERVAAIRRSLTEGIPFGDPLWSRRMAQRLGVIRRYDRVAGTRKHPA
jgi:putative transposase